MSGFILAQIFGGIALVLVCLSYSFRSKKSFLAYQIVANIFYGASFLAVNALVGGVNTIISILRVSILYIFERKNKKPPIYIYLIFFALYLASGIIFYESPVDILAIVAYQIFNIAMFIPWLQVTRLVMIPPNMMIIAYNIISLTYTNAVLDAIEIIVLFSSFFYYLSYEKRKMKYLI